MQGVLLVLCICGVFLLLVVIQVIMKSKRPVRRAVGGILTGLFTLVAVNLTGMFTGVSLPISPLTIGVSGVAGIPGVTLLLLLNLVFK
ncbi:MAG TPA: pro-sigmaK processing inhibitor BofA family protein [Caproicibacter sp.]|nr:pro-sigmaK processing inhibitor BofA family protein [Caproicibacter sp.]